MVQHSITKQSKAKQSKAKQSKAKQSKAKPTNPNQSPYHPSHKFLPSLHFFFFFSPSPVTQVAYTPPSSHLPSPFLPAFT
jgi:hypothetical protein